MTVNCPLRRLTPSVEDTAVHSESQRHSGELPIKSLAAFAPFEDAQNNKHGCADNEQPIAELRKVDVKSETR